MGDSTDLPTNCGRSCYVRVKRLTEEEIQRYTSVKSGSTAQGYKDNLLPNTQIRYGVRDASSSKAGKFDSYRKIREKFLNRSLRQSSTEMTDLNAFSGDEYSDPSEDEQYKSSRALKRRRYEDDLEWSPNSDGKYHTEKRFIKRPRKIGLRVNTRRKRIESNSSCSSDDDSFYYEADYQTKDQSNVECLKTPNGVVAVNKAVTPVSSLATTSSSDSNLKKGVLKLSRDSSPLIDNDLLSKIFNEMSDYNMKNSKPANKFNEYEGMDKSNIDNSKTEINHYPPAKKRQSHLFKITDEDVTPSLNSVQQILRKIVNQVCTSERRRLFSSLEKKKTCKCCDVQFYPGTNTNDSIDNDLCSNCRSVFKASKITSMNKAKTAGGGTSTKAKTTGKIKSKLYKNLPKYDQQRLAYSGQADKLSVGKGYNHCKSFLTPKDVESSEKVGSGNKIVVKDLKKVKLKKKKDSIDLSENSQVIKKKKKINSESEKNINKLKPKMKSSGSLALSKPVGEKKQKHVSVTNVDKGLFLMTFPEPHQELEIPQEELNNQSVSGGKKVEKSTSITPQNQSDVSLNEPIQSVTNNVQYGTYLLPPVPTVVVANYAATDAKSGDYYLSSVYYQNEMTRSKNTPQKNENIMTVTTSAGLPSMPSLDQLSSISPSFSFPSACHLNSLPITDFNLPASMDGSKTVLFQQHMISPPNMSIPTYSSQGNLNVFNNSSDVACTSYQASSDSNISSLLNNPGLQSQSLLSKDSDNTFDLFQNQDLNLIDAYDDNSNLNSENCSESLGVVVKDSVLENLHNASHNNSSFNSETPIKQLENNESLASDTSKVPEQNMVLNQSSSGAANISVESFDHSETQNLSSEALIEYCSAELDALCILGVVDLDKNPKWTLKRRIDSNKNECEKLKNTDALDKQTQGKLKYLELNGRTLQIASSLLSRFGSFSRLSDSILWKQRLLEMKNEKSLELEEARSSCQFAKSAPIPPLLNQDEPIKANESVSSAIRLKMENVQSCSFASRSIEPVNHIEKIQTQIQSIPENSSVTMEPGHLGLVHHFPAPDMPVASSATLSITPRTEMMNEFRETPSRGSGPRTPARPESAMSQNDEGVLTPLQIKKERLEASSSPLSQCAFSQNATASPRIPTSTPNISQTVATSVNNLALVGITPVNSQMVNSLGNQRHVVAPAVSINNSNMMQHNVVPNVSISNNSQIQSMMQHNVVSAVPINSSNSQIPNIQHNATPVVSVNNNCQIQKVMQMHQGQVGPPNVTIPFPASNQNFTKVVVNKLPQPPPPSNVVANVNPHPSSANVIVRGNYMNVQPVYMPGTTSVSQRYVQSSVPAINNNINSLNVYKQAMTSGGTMLVNSIGQNYALSNPQVMNQQQVPRVYNTSNVQQAVQVPNSVNQASSNTAFLMPNSKPEEPSQMSCAVCNKPATLRCKQCAKVAYCDTVCARSYWHQRHKMECKIMSGNT